MKDQKISQEDFERIDSYLNNSIVHQERIEFERLLKTDDLLVKQVNEVKVLLQAIEEQSLRNELNDIHEKNINEYSTQKTRGKLQQLSGYRKLAIAASIVILMGFGYWLIDKPQSSNEKLFTEYFKADPGLITSMGNTAHYELFRGMVDYKQGNYSLAIERWKQLVVQKPTNDTLNYYLGVSYLALDESKKAIDYLLISSQELNSIFIHESHFNLGLAYLKENRIQEAVNSLEKSNMKSSKLLINTILKTNKK